MIVPDEEESKRGVHQEDSVPTWKETVDAVCAKSSDLWDETDRLMLELDRMDEVEIDAWALDHRPDLYDKFDDEMDRDGKLMVLFGLADGSETKGPTWEGVIEAIQAKPPKDRDERDNLMMELNRRDDVGIRSWALDYRHDLYDKLGRGMGRDKMLLVIYNNYWR